MDVKEIRRVKLRVLLVEYEGKQTKLAPAIKKVPAQISQWLNGTRSISEESARDIEKQARKPPGWLDSPEGYYALIQASADEGVGTMFARQPDAATFGWPFADITPRQWQRLSAFHRAQVEGFIRGLLAATPAQ